MQKLLQESKKSKTLCFKKSAKSIQGKVVLTLASLAKLMGIMEE